LSYRFALTQSITQGIVNEGETPIEAAMRELQEETNIDLKGEEQLASLIPAPDAQPINSYTVGKGAAKKTVRSCQYMCVITAVSLTGT
jgi:8-oxo-dGTP pyrophosphatase MutT (NUDIX family)